MTPPARIASARTVLGAALVAAIVVASLPWVASAGVDAVHAMVTVLR